MKEPQVFSTDLIISLAMRSQLKSSEILKKVAIVTASAFKNVVSSVYRHSCKLSARDLTKITEYVKPHSHKWKEIRQGLGFTAQQH